ncbi:MAG: guanylate kinase [Phycisphaerales bacterium]|nr:guanylate kinase [Phycisphaerales bacterium]
MSSTNRGNLLVISGPSGAGKTSICEALLKRLPNARWSVSATTRAKRANEIDGRNYRFITRADFERMSAAGEFIETTEYLGECYGTPRKPVEEAVARGEIVVLEIDVTGGAQIARAMPGSIRVFVLPPTMETLKARLEGRKTESEELQARRIAKADGEIAFARNEGYYQYFITNDILEDSIQQVLNIVNKETVPA